MIKRPIGQALTSVPAGAAESAGAAPDALALTKALLDSAPVAVYHTDAAGNMTYSNPEYRRIFGLELGHDPDAWAQRVHPEDRARMQSAWAEFCRRPTAPAVIRLRRRRETSCPASAPRSVRQSFPEGPHLAPPESAERVRFAYDW